MFTSFFELFRVGIGPSSSHTVGPMIAAADFIQVLKAECDPSLVHKVQIELYGSLAHTGVGHGTDRAIILGLMGEHPATIDTDTILPRFFDVVSSGRLPIDAVCEVAFNYNQDIIYNKKDQTSFHSNAIDFRALDKKGRLIVQQRYYSIGGGFVCRDELPLHVIEDKSVPYQFSSGNELLNLCKNHDKTIAEIVFQNEAHYHSPELVDQHLSVVIQTMENCINAGLEAEGVLPGSRGVRRRAKSIYRKLLNTEDDNRDMDVHQWLNVYAMAVNEENAAGHRVVTAPTNGAAGVIPAIYAYAKKYLGFSTFEDHKKYLLTAAAIGKLFKQNASISGAEVGCQGEVGVASAMAAAGLAALWGGTPQQIENAAEIAMEHHLGMTCDPVDGLVQIPCIERNAMGTNKAFNAAKLACAEDGMHYVSLDSVIETMYEVGQNMSILYKETAQGGLARQLAIPEC